MWKRVITFLVILFFVLLSDAVLSDWVPGYLQNILGSSFKMGLMMALSSVVGLLMDLIFPHVLRASGVRKLAGGAIVGSLIFLLSMFSSTWWSYALILAVGMAAWGVYYELDSFMTQQFVAGTAPRDQRSSVWGIVGVVRSLAYFCGPILGGYIASFGDRAVVIGSGAHAKLTIKGVIKIAKEAQETEAFLEMRVLLVDSTAYAKADPELEIEANNVKASHAASIGQIDPEQVMYLMSRGLSMEDAKSTIINGFLGVV